MKLQSADGGELMEVLYSLAIGILAGTALERDGNRLVIRGKVFGAMPLDARMGPDAARAALKLLTPALLWFLLTLPFRRSNAG